MTAPASHEQPLSAPAIATNNNNEEKEPMPIIMQHQHHVNKELHIAPMLNYSTREFRQLIRILSERVTLWTEMVVDETVAHSPNLDEHLAYDSTQHPIVCQIGGNSPQLCGKATSIVLEQFGYDEVNLNIDCPSERVSGKREFGACLMKKAELARRIVAEMQTNAPSLASKVSVKCRIGVDDLDDLEFAAEFIRTLQPVCQRFYLHSRKCVLGGLMNARQNRSVPPLNYPRVFSLCHMFPDCLFWINGGIKSIDEARMIAYGWNGGCKSIDADAKDAHQVNHQVPCTLCNLPYGSCTQPPVVAPANLRGVMMGRAAMDDPCLFYNADKYFFNEPSNPCQTRRDVLERYCVYLEEAYPRRCCDNDERFTFECPAPNIVHDRDCCKVCAEIYCPEQFQADASSTFIDENNRDGKNIGNKNKEKKNTRSKMSSRIIARSLKPVQGLFAGIPDTRIWRRTCDNLGQNAQLRNCGPGFLLRMAMRSIDDKILDRPFDHGELE